jgi:uncharacterized membrane protein (UPF0127 family)
MAGVSRRGQSAVLMWWSVWLITILFLSAIGCGVLVTPTPSPTVTPTVSPAAVPIATPTAIASPDPQVPRVSFGDVTFAVDLAATAGERALGLSGRPSIGRNRGMLFIYEADATPGFWMRGMLFPLDIIWIDGQGEVVGVSSGRAPAPGGSQPPRYYPPSPIRYVLEVNAGLAEELRIGPGSRALFSGIPLD